MFCDVPVVDMCVDTDGVSTVEGDIVVFCVDAVFSSSDVLRYSCVEAIIDVL